MSSEEPVEIDPEVFRALHNIPGEVPIVGAFGGALANEGEKVALSYPAEFTGGVVEFILVDEVRYDDVFPWSTRPDGRGYSLERIVATAYGNESANWDSSTRIGGTPGAPNSISGTGENQEPRASFNTSSSSGEAESLRMAYCLRSGAMR